MPYDLQATGTSLRKEVVDRMVKQIGQQSYKLKQVVSVIPTSAWSNVYYRENPAVLTGPSGNAIKGLAPGANFPQKSVDWEKVTGRITKFGLEENIIWERIISGDINVQARTIIRVTEGVVNAVDTHIWDELSESRLLTGRTHSFAVAVGSEWDTSGASLIRDLMKASRLIAKANYPTSNLVAIISPYDKESIMDYLVKAGSQFPMIATDVTRNGNIGRVAGVDLIECNAVTASYALVVVPKTCATWKELVPLQSEITTDPYKSVRMRIVEEGLLELTDPLAVVRISNTQKVGA